MKENKLRVRWSKGEKDILAIYPLGIGTGCDANLMLSIFNKEFVKELKDRGYDITTLKFEVKVDEKHKRFPERFPTLYKETQEKK